jgi:hypothetical protein
MNTFTDILEGTEREIGGIRTPLTLRGGAKSIPIAVSDKERAEEVRQWHLQQRGLLQYLLPGHEGLVKKSSLAGLFGVDVDKALEKPKQATDLSPQTGSVLRVGEVEVIPVEADLDATVDPLTALGNEKRGAGLNDHLRQPPALENKRNE